MAKKNAPLLSMPRSHGVIRVRPACGLPNFPSYVDVIFLRQIGTIAIMSWVFLLMAGCFEIGFTTAMRLSEGFTRLGPTAAFLTCSALSFLCLEKSLNTIPLGTAYAVWVGVGAAGTAVMGVWAFDEQLTGWQMMFIATLMFSVAGLKMSSTC
jgi:quaternary ammonium compound-resistance protein SugE